MSNPDPQIQAAAEAAMSGDRRTLAELAEAYGAEIRAISARIRKLRREGHKLVVIGPSSVVVGDP